ncbi:protein required for attachment to host cells [Altererythrobacter atlanticus]|uniref:Attachment protein n=1 Tax=Croceibacterium atlanticum TaxID=1267766 RepID=A0A0F7KNM8_9SPHN|nr:host attachment family protein [Croceibacterium atlanticum]AKH42118.1 attachment protein [Croceibacterium atlanticum]MBB5733312.1 protein required for attachment to host cells [Croceibacterium atlanticum]
MKIENGALVLVADGQKLLLFRNEGDEKYPVLTTLVHDEAQNPASRMQGDDTPGRTRSSSGEMRSSYQETNWHDEGEEAFSRKAAESLEKCAEANPEGEIVVIADPHSLGQLRQHYGNATRARLCGEIAKDLVRHTTDDIVNAIESFHP